MAGGAPIALTTKSIERCGALNGVILGGGQDVFPMLFDDTPKQGYLYDRARDRMEVELAKSAIELDAPVLGICRGAQLLNVSYGGSLHLDLAKAYEDANYPDSLFAKIFFRKLISTKTGSLIRVALKRNNAEVNSLHKQAVKRVGDGLIATACEKNGVIQSIEDPARKFVLGVQFHPEFMLHRSMFRRVFALLVEAAQNAVIPADRLATIAENVKKTAEKNA